MKYINIHISNLRERTNNNNNNKISKIIMKDIVWFGKWNRILIEIQKASLIIIPKSCSTKRKRDREREKKKKTSNGLTLSLKYYLDLTKWENAAKCEQNDTNKILNSSDYPTGQNKITTEKKCKTIAANTISSSSSNSSIWTKQQNGWQFNAANIKLQPNT